MKWTVEANDQRQPIGRGRVLHVASQFGDAFALQVWTEEECDEQGRPVQSPDRAAFVVGTGHPVPEGCEFLGTAIPAGADGHLVWHAYGAAS